MKPLLFSPATFNLAETTRCIEAAKAVKDRFDTVFMSFGGQFEKLLENEGFNLEKIRPRLTPEKIEHIYKIDQGEKVGRMFSKGEIQEQVESELKVIDKYKPSAIITGFDFAASISARVRKVPLIWLTQSTWDLEQMIRLGLGGYTDDFDRPVLRLTSERFRQKLSIMMIKVLGAVIAGPYNAAAQRFGVKKFRRIEELWQGDYNLLAEPEDFSGNTELPPYCHYIGPLIAQLGLPIPEEVKKFTKDKPVVYFAMGSSGRLKVIKKILEGFKGQPFSVIAPLKAKICGLNIDIPENVTVTDWVDALEVSKMADLSVIHGGIGTVMTAALAGKPVVGIGMMYEQEYNIECLVRKGFAKRISRNNLSCRLLNDTIKSLLSDEKAKQKAKDYQAIIEKWHNPEIIKNFFENHIYP